MRWIPLRTRYDKTYAYKKSINDKTLKQIELADSILGYLLKSIKNLNIKNQINIIVVSEHGMVDVSENRLINESIMCSY